MYERGTSHTDGCSGHDWVLHSYTLLYILFNLHSYHSASAVALESVVKLLAITFSESYTGKSKVGHTLMKVHYSYHSQGALD